MKSLEKHDKLISSFNEDIDSLIKEYGISDLTRDLSTLRSFGPIGLITKKILSREVDNTEDEIDKKKEELKKAKEKKKSEKDETEARARIKSMEATLASLELKLNSLLSAKQTGLPFQRIEIRFKGKTSLDIEPLHSPEFKRNLMGTMYFTVVGINEKVRFLDLKTKSFPNTVVIRLYYDTLKTGADQRTKAYLKYNRYGNVQKGSVEGEEKEVYFKIIKSN